MTSPSLYWYSSTIFSILWSCLLLDFFGVSHGDAVTYCDINFFNFWNFLRNCDTGAIQSKTSQEVIRRDVSSHIESDMDSWTFVWKNNWRFAGQELLEELQELSYQVLSSKKKALPAHMVGLAHDTTLSVRISSFYWLCQIMVTY